MMSRELTLYHSIFYFFSGRCAVVLVYGASEQQACRDLVGDGTESPKGHEKKRRTFASSGLQDQSILYVKKVPAE